MSDQMVITHYGRMYGIVPVCLDMTNPELPLVEVRHWSLEPLLDICDALYGLLIFLKTTVDPDYEPTFPVLITHEALTGKGGE